MPTRTALSPAMGTRPQSGHRSQQPESASRPDALRPALKVLAGGASIGSCFPAGPRRRACAGPERRAAGACGGLGWVGAYLARRDRSGARLVGAGRLARRTEPVRRTDRASRAARTTGRPHADDLRSLRRFPARAQEGSAGRYGARDRGAGARHPRALPLVDIIVGSPSVATVAQWQIHQVVRR